MYDINIIVKNDSKIVFKGIAEEWLIKNDYDEEIEEMILECHSTGKSKRQFISGKWECIALQ